MITPKWVKDLQSYVDSVPYGKLSVNLLRVANKTAEVETQGLETLRYEENSDATADILKFLKNLADISYNGEVVFKVQWKGGKMKEIGFYNSKLTRYSE